MLQKQHLEELGGNAQLLVVASSVAKLGHEVGIRVLRYVFFFFKLEVEVFALSLRHENQDTR